jgi:uncharacterized protein (DUF433 family)
MNKITFLLSHPEIQEGSPVFIGTHVRYETFCDYMRIGVPLNEFLQEFPSISKDEAQQALEMCRQNLPLERIAGMSMQLSDLRAGSR